MKTLFETMPIAASAQTTAKSTQPRAPRSETSVKGVYVPAIRT